MEPVNSLNRLTELLRRRITAEAGKKACAAPVLAGKDASVAGYGKRIGVDALREQIVRALESVDVDDPACTKKTMRIFIESVLAWQFGAEMLADPGFANLIAEVQESMAKEPAVAAALTRFISGKTGGF